MDLGQIAAMLRSLITAQAEMRAEMTARFDEQGRMLSEHSRILAEHSRRLQELARNGAESRKEVAMYHASVLGHGSQISERDARLRRIGEPLHLPSAA